MKHLIIPGVLLLLFSSVNLTAQWVQTDGPRVGDTAPCIAISGSNMFIGTGNGVYFSTNNGGSWIPAGLNNLFVHSLANSGTNLFAGTEYNGIYLSANNGQTWIQEGLSNMIVYSILINGTSIISGTNSGVFLSTNNGQTWTQTGLNNLYVYSLANSGTNVFAGTGLNGVYLSTNNGQNWVQTSLNNQSVVALAISGSSIFAGVESNNPGLDRSTNNGQTWEQTGLNNILVKSLAVYNSKIIAGTSLGISVSTDNGQIWTQTALFYRTVYAVAVSGSNVFAGTQSYGVYLSTNGAQTWHPAAGWINTSVVRSVISSGPNIFAGTANSQNNYGINGMYLSTNNGARWTLTMSSVNPYISVLSSAASGPIIVAGTSGTGIYRSTDSGQNWVLSGLNYPNLAIQAVAISGSNIFVGTSRINNNQTEYGVYLSTNDGQNWSQTSLNFKDVYSIAISGTNVFAGVFPGIYRSTDNGLTWSLTLSVNRVIYSLAVSGSTVYAGTSDIYQGSGLGVFVSNDNGQTWSQSSLNSGIVRSLLARGTNVFAGTSNGVYLSTNSGLTWLQVNEGIGNRLVYSLNLTADYAYVGTDGASVWKRPLSELIGINPISEEVPKEFMLFQNYPNPFNPVTKIKFALPPSPQGEGLGGRGIIYDILVREVTTLVNENLKPGTYEVEWPACRSCGAGRDASNYPSGVYYYKLIAGDYSETKKMVVIK